MALSDLVTLIGTLIAVVVAVNAMYSFYRNHRPDPGELVRRAVLSTFAVVAVFAVLLIFTRSASTLNDKQITLLPVPTATATGAQQTAVVPNGTPTGTPAATAAPNTPQSYDQLPQYADETKSVDWRLSCGGCDQRFLVTVTQVVTSASMDNMVWTVTLYNHTAATSYAQLSVTLTDPDGNTYRATGGLTQESQKLAPGQTATTQITFGFLPRHGGTLQLRASVNYGFPSYSSSDYGPEPETF